jgi:hypothetical protein
VAAFTSSGHFRPFEVTPADARCWDAPDDFVSEHPIGTRAMNRYPSQSLARIDSSADRS